MYQICWRKASQLRSKSQLHTAEKSHLIRAISFSFSTSRNCRTSSRRCFSDSLRPVISGMGGSAGEWQSLVGGAWSNVGWGASVMALDMVREAMAARQNETRARQTRANPAPNRRRCWPRRLQLSCMARRSRGRRVRARRRNFPDLAGLHCACGLACGRGGAVHSMASRSSSASDSDIFVRRSTTPATRPDDIRE